MNRSQNMVYRHLCLLFWNEKKIIPRTEKNSNTLTKFAMERVGVCRYSIHADISSSPIDSIPLKTYVEDHQVWSYTQYLLL